MQRNMNDLETENEGMYESDIHTEIGMRNLLTKALYETGEEERIEAFESAGLLPMDKGIVVKLTNGSNFYITIVKSR